MLKPGYYQHYKGANGGKYLLIGIADHENTGEKLVVYQAMYGEKTLYARPFSQFEEPVEWLGEMVPRFKYLGEQSID